LAPSTPPSVTKKTVNPSSYAGKTIKYENNLNYGIFILGETILKITKSVNKEIIGQCY